jgi:hypothetical protein
MNRQFLLPNSCHKGLGVVEWGMDDEVVFKPSAFNHGITEADILKAIDGYLYDGPMDDDVNKRLLLGFDAKNNLLEIMYNIITENRINVFHAMKARKAFMALLDK